MKAWEHIINTAMLGTDKPLPGNQDANVDLDAITRQIDSDDTLDKELKFLHRAALTYNYRQCGFVPLQNQDMPVNIASVELRPYCTEKASAVLNDVLAEDNTALLELWLIHCAKNEQLILPEVLPQLFDKVQQSPLLQALAAVCSGNRAQWLSQFNTAWNYFTVLPDDEVWQTGKPEERLKVLKRLRESDPPKARERVIQTWLQETAASKTELLKVLSTNASVDDLPWLESLTTEKGQKVKDEVMALLKRIPGSSIIKQYEALLAESVILKKEKALFGMMNKTSIQMQLPDTIDESIFKSGIEKLAGQKSKITDEEYIIYQLINHVPPSFWEHQFSATPAQVVEYFEKYATSMLSALYLAVSGFKEKTWIHYFLHHDAFYMDFVDLMTAVEQEKYLLKFLHRDPQDIIAHALRLRNEWGFEFAKTALSYLSNDSYRYNRQFYNQNIGLIPVGIINRLEKIDAKDSNLQATWEKTRTHLTKLLTLKQQILQAFNA